VSPISPILRPAYKQSLFALIFLPPAPFPFFHANPLVQPLLINLAKFSTASLTSFWHTRMTVLDFLPSSLPQTEVPSLCLGPPACMRANTAMFPGPFFLPPLKSLASFQAFNDRQFLNGPAASFPSGPSLSLSFPSFHFSDSKCSSQTTCTSLASACSVRFIVGPGRPGLFVRSSCERHPVSLLMEPRTLTESTCL